jgi:hypothetical protein
VTKPQVFIASSSEGLDAAQAIRGLLAADAHVTMWDEGFFKLSRGYLETLVDRVGTFDFAVFVATPDDMIVTRDETHPSPRDNILFELGLFMGRLGRDHTFLVHPSGAGMRFPSDLLGIMTASCPWPDARTARPTLRDYTSALGPVCDRIRDALRQWSDRSAADVLRSSGFERCYTNSTEAQAAIGAAITGARSSILLMATNLSYTPVLNLVELQEKIAAGVDVRFLVLNPLSALVDVIAAEFLYPADLLRQENRLHLQTLVGLQAYALSCPGAGTVSIRLFDAPPQMRAYVFDGDDGMSFFVPYAPRSTTRPLPVYHCRNGGTVARRYTAGIERLWNGADTLTLQQFLDDNDGFRGAGEGAV